MASYIVWLRHLLLMRRRSIKKKSKFSWYLPEKINIRQKVKSGVPDRNCRFHDTIPHIISKKTITLIKIIFYFWNPIKFI